MQKVIDWLSANWPLIAVVVPSILVGLTKAPRDGSASDWLKWFMQLFSVVTHKDDAGTFKLPFTAKKLPKSSPVAPIAAFVLISFLSQLSGCAWWNSTGKQVAKDVVDCAVESVRGQAPTLIEQIYKFLDGGEASWGSALAALETAGMDALPCAVLAVIGDLTVKQSTSLKAGNKLVADLHAKKVKFLMAYLAKKNLKLTFKAV